MNGKGDKPRPYSIPRVEFDKKWDKIDWTKKQTTTDERTDKSTTKTTSK